MDGTHKRLPPMSSLRPFEAAARHSSFSKAANELCVTQAAISKQVRALELHLGQKLFLREGPKVTLTSDGRNLQQAVSLGLSHIASAAAEIRRKTQPGRMAIAMRLPFASQFMAPRFGELRASFPDIDISILSTERNPLVLLNQVDMAIVLGYEPQPDLFVDHLLTEEIFPVCSPGFVTRNPGLRTVQDIPDHQLLHLDVDHWRDLDWEPINWPVVTRALGVKREVELAGPSFNNYELLISAAVSGLGLAISWRHLCEDLLARGHLVRPVAESYQIDRKHYLITHAAIAEDRTVRRLRAWFVAETSRFR